MTITTKAHVESDGTLTIRVPDVFKGKDVELTMTESLPSEQDPWAGVPRDANGWPVGFFEATAGSFASDRLEPSEQCRVS